ncbi:MAG: hydrogenase subunit MbhD domain-containing protein [Sedimenticolaceae bacterium]
MLQAPDVAMTEAAVGAGLSSLILALALRRLGLIRLAVGGDAGDDDA